MKTAWELKKLRDVCELVNGRAYGKSELLTEGKYRVLRVGNFFTNNHWYYSDLELKDKKYCDQGDLLYAWSASFGPRIWTGEKVIYHYHIWKVVPDASVIDQRYLFHFLNWDTESIKEDQGAGTTMLHVSKGSMEDRDIQIPPLPEQQRIVALLDEAFDGIATARAHAEKNLQNARAIFESHLQSVFARRRDGWQDKTLEQISATFGRGKSKHRPRNDPALYGGKYPFIQTGDVRNAGHFITEFSQTYSEAGLAQSKLWPKGTICITIAANIAETGILGFDACFPDSVIGVVPNPTEAEVGFVEYLLQSFKVRLQALGQGSAQANINMGTFENERFPFPSVAEQRRIVSKLDGLSEETQRLESVYQRKLAALDALKKSLLHQAFSGQLTSAKQTKASLQAALQTTTPEFTANIICLAHARHERQKREKTFGRVKEQKTLHLVESIARIDLGRHPMKDAAGPNDFQHMLKAEEWAKAHGFFEMVKRDGGYDFKKLSAFDEYLSRARQALAPYLPQLESVIDLLVPMDKEEAEVFATVHAAWNNLLIDGLKVTDDAIVSAAREGWHADKLDIPEHRFRTAIALIRQKGLVPDGTGKYVGGQPRLI